MFAKKNLNKLEMKYKDKDEKPSFLSSITGGLTVNKNKGFLPIPMNRGGNLGSINEETKQPEKPNNSIDELEKEVNDLSIDKVEKSKRSDEDEFEGGDDLDAAINEAMKDTSQIVGEDDDDENQEAEEFEELLTQYHPQKFIRDLIKVLQFDESELQETCPAIVNKRLRMFDESLQRKVHLYEHIILLSHGFCRSGLLKILTNRGVLDANSVHRISKPYEPGHNNFYDACITFVSAYQGDLDNFSKYCKGLLTALELEGNNDFPARDKAVKTLMLIKGDSIMNEIEGISATNNQYASIFEKLFGKQYHKAMYLHKLATMEEDELIQMFISKDSQAKSTKIENSKKLGKLLIEEFMVRHLEMDTDSIEWLAALTRISMGDYEGFDYIAKEYDISNTKSSIYKAICTQDFLYMDPLFHAIDSEVPFELCKQLSWVLNGDIDEFSELILNRIQIDTHKHKFKLTYDNVYKVALPEELAREKEDLCDYMKILFSLIEGESFDLGDLKKIVRLCGIDENIAYVFQGYNAILNKDFNNVIELFEYQKFKDKMGNKPLMDAILGLASSRWDVNSLKLVLENVIISNNLYTHCNVSDKVDQMVNSIEFETIINLMEAVEGDMQSLGQI